MASTKLSNGVTLPVTKATNENEGPAVEQRAVEVPAKLDAGPKVNAETGTYEPAAYLVHPGIVRIDR